MTVPKNHRAHLIVLTLACSLFLLPTSASAETGDWRDFFNGGGTTTSNTQTTTYASPSAILSYNQTGYLKFVSAGQGLTSWNSDGTRGSNSSTGAITMDLGGTPMYGVAYWHGYDNNAWNGTQTRDEIGNSIVQFEGNWINGTELHERDENNDGKGDEYGLGYWCDVSNALVSGTNTYNINNVDFNTSDGGINNGWGMVAVYEDQAQSQWGRVMIAQGMDRAYERTGLPTPPNGPDSEVVTFNFEAEDYARTIDVSMTFAGGEGDVRYDYPDRKSQIYYYYGTDGSTPDSLIGNSSAFAHPDQHVVYGRDGADWDTYIWSFELPAYSDVLAFQVDSLWDAESPHPASFSWLNTTVFIPEPIPEPTTMALFGLGLGALGFRRKKSR